MAQRVELVHTDTFILEPPVEPFESLSQRGFEMNTVVPSVARCPCGVLWAYRVR